MTTTRYEAWMFAFMITLLTFKKLKWKSLIFMTFPLIWLILSYIHTGSLFGFAHQVAGMRKIGVRIQDTSFYNFLIIALTSGCFLGLIYLGKNKTYLWIFLGSLIMMVLAVSNSGATATHNLWRLGLSWDVLLIPFVAYTIVEIKNKYLSYGLFIVVLFLFLRLDFQHSRESYLTQNDIKTGEVIDTLQGSILLPQFNNW